MRSAVGFVILLTAFSNASLAQDKTQDKAAAKTPSDKEIIDMVGNRMSKAFPKFGYPVDMSPSKTGDKQLVFMDYGAYGFKVGDKVVTTCFFFSDWKGAVFGAKMGDSKEEVVKKLGKPASISKMSDGLPYLEWSFKDQPGTLEINFDKDNKMTRAIVSAD
jgi:hypothetical protein